MSELPEPDPSAIVTLLQGLPRVKITPETITQHLIDQWYEREREYRARIAELEARVDRFKKQRAGWSGISDLCDEANEYEAERDRLKATIERVRDLGPGLAVIDPAELYGDTERAEILASAGRAILAVLAKTADQTKDTP